jgi:acyl-CoA thioesterase FadM
VKHIWGYGLHGLFVLFVYFVDNCFDFLLLLVPATVRCDPGGRNMMDVTQLPLNQFLGLEPADPDSGFLVSLPAGPQYTNHVGTVHAVALLGVAEAASGEFLIRYFNGVTVYVPVVRRLESKFRRPAHGRISGRVSVADSVMERAVTELEAKGRALVELSVEVVDESGVVALTAQIEWFISKAA